MDRPDQTTETAKENHRAQDNKRQPGWSSSPAAQFLGWQGAAPLLQAPSLSFIYLFFRFDTLRSMLKKNAPPAHPPVLPAPVLHARLHPRQCRASRPPLPVLLLPPLNTHDIHFQARCPPQHRSVPPLLAPGSPVTHAKHTLSPFSSARPQTLPQSSRPRQRGSAPAEPPGLFPGEGALNSLCLYSSGHGLQAKRRHQWRLQRGRLSGRGGQSPCRCSPGQKKQESSRPAWPARVPLSKIQQP